MVICPYNGFQQNGTFGTFGTYFFWLALKKNYGKFWNKMDTI